MNQLNFLSDRLARGARARQLRPALAQGFNNNDNAPNTLMSIGRRVTVRVGGRVRLPLTTISGSCRQMNRRTRFCAAVVPLMGMLAFVLSGCGGGSGDSGGSGDGTGSGAGTDPNDVTSVFTITNFKVIPDTETLRLSWTNPNYNQITEFHITRNNLQNTDDNQTTMLNRSAPVKDGDSISFNALASVKYSITGLNNTNTYTVQVAVVIGNGSAFASDIRRHRPGKNADNDSLPASLDAFDNDPCATTDTDRDNKPDFVLDDCDTELIADTDDDNDNVNDFAADGITQLDACPRGDTGWTSNASTDNDQDGCRDEGTEDPDDDNDGKEDTDITETCPRGDIGWTSAPDTDMDNDGCRDAGEDTDDDDDTVPDLTDNCVYFQNTGQADNDSDGVGDACDPRRSVFSVSNLNATEGFVVLGHSTSSKFEARDGIIGGGLGRSIAGLGDINGDAIADFAVGALGNDLPGGIKDVGELYVMYGRRDSDYGRLEDGGRRIMRTELFDASDGFIVRGQGSQPSYDPDLILGERLGTSVAALGDINGDNRPDFAVGAESGGPLDEGRQAGHVYVLYGRGDSNYGVMNGSARVLHTATLTGAQGFTVRGQYDGDELGRAPGSIAGLGDINNDGIPDIGLSAGNYPAVFGVTNGIGALYVLYGRRDTNYGELIAATSERPFSQRLLEVRNPPAPAAGWTLFGDVRNEGIGESISPLGDITGDGIPDFGTFAINKFRVVYGRDDNNFGVEQSNPRRRELNTTARSFNAESGFTVEAENPANTILSIATGLEDINGDGVHDFAVRDSAQDVDKGRYGKVYVIYGRQDQNYGVLDPTSNQRNLRLGDHLNASVGFIIRGTAERLITDNNGGFVYRIGDINGDGAADFALSRIHRQNAAGLDIGELHVFYGRKNNNFGLLENGSRSLSLDALNASVGFTVEGELDLTNTYPDFSRGTRGTVGLGDINGDRMDDFAISGFSYSKGADELNSGILYVIYGQNETAGRLRRPPPPPLPLP